MSRKEAAAEIEAGGRRKEIADEACMKLRVWKLERVETTVSCAVDIFCPCFEEMGNNP